MSYTVIIPARFASTRLPGKPLRLIAGKPMIAHVYERAQQSGAQRVIIATDDQRIEQVCKAFGAEVCMTSADHTSGTDRIAEVLDIISAHDDEIIVNLQGDEPFMPAALITQVADALASHSDAAAATVCTPIDDEAALFDPNIVKVVRDQADFALYFSRAPIPWDRKNSPKMAVDPAKLDFYQRHIGLYAYRAKLIRQFVRWDPAPIEALESLEQLRILWQGLRMIVPVACDIPAIGIDTEDDLARAEQLMRSA